MECAEPSITLERGRKHCVVRAHAAGSHCSQTAASALQRKRFDQGCQRGHKCTRPRLRPRPLPSRPRPRPRPVFLVSRPRRVRGLNIPGFDRTAQEHQSLLHIAQNIWKSTEKLGGAGCMTCSPSNFVGEHLLPLLTTCSCVYVDCTCKSLSLSFVSELLFLLQYRPNLIGYIPNTSAIASASYSIFAYFGNEF